MMEIAAGITVYDVVIIALFAILIVRGIWLGFLKQITGLLALYLGYIVASQYHEQFFPFLKHISDNPTLVFLASYAILFIATYIAVMLLGKFLAYAVQVSLVGWFDRFLGAVLGFAKALIIVILIHMVAGAVVSPESTMLKKCASCSILNDATDLTRAIIRSEEVRKALRQREPAISLDSIRKYIPPVSFSLTDSDEPKEEHDEKK